MQNLKIKWFLNYYCASFSKKFMRYKLILSFLLFTNTYCLATTDSLLTAAMDSIEREYSFEENSTIPIKDLGILKLNSNFKFLNEEKTNDFVRTYWGASNEAPGYLGIILQKNKSIFDTSALLFTIHYLPNLLIDASNSNFVNDNKVLESLIKQSDKLDSVKREYELEPVKILNWSIPPHYSKEMNCLYWAEEIESGIYATKKQISIHFRFIGKEGVLAFDCVSSLNAINFLKNEMKAITSFFKFNENNNYSQTAIGSNHKSIEFLIIGSVIDKRDFGAFIFKFWKAILFIVGICGVILFFQFKPSKN